MSDLKSKEEKFVLENGMESNRKLNEIQGK